MMNGCRLYETHSHTPLCKHAIGEPEEYAAAAAQRGLAGLIVTCHNPMPAGFAPHVRMDASQFDRYIDLVARARAAWTNQVDVCLGLEADYLPGYERWLEQQLASADFHYVLGSVHPQLAEFRRTYASTDARETQLAYFRLLAEAAETGLFDCLAHPDLVKNETPEQWRPAEIMNEIRDALDRIAATGTAMELNTSGANKRIAEMNPLPEMLIEMRTRDIPVVIGADAHEPGRVADRFEEALTLLTSCGYTEVSLFLNRNRQTLPIEGALATLRVPAAVA